MGVGERLVVRQGDVRIEKLAFSPSKIGEYGLTELNQYATLLEDAIRIRASKHCNWVYMTGGWDSSTITSLLVKQFGFSHVPRYALGRKGHCG